MLREMSRFRVYDGDAGNDVMSIFTPWIADIANLLQRHDASTMISK
jgi:hypothetical protein